MRGLGPSLVCASRLSEFTSASIRIAAAQRDVVMDFDARFFPRAEIFLLSVLPRNDATRPFVIRLAGAR